MQKDVGDAGAGGASKKKTKRDVIYVHKKEAQQMQLNW